MVRVEDRYLSEPCRVQQDNPKKGASADRYDSYKAARTLREILTLGGSRGDIGNDMVRGYIVVEDPAIQEAILLTANESERKRLPRSLQAKLPPPGEKPPPAARPAPGPAADPRFKKKHKSAPAQPGFILMVKVQTHVQRFDPDAFNGMADREMAEVEAETTRIARRDDGTEILSTKVYPTAGAVNAAALQLVVDKVAQRAVDSADGLVRVAEDFIVPSENTIRNSGSTDDRGATTFRTRVNLWVDARKSGLENNCICVITVKPMWQSE